MNSETSPDIPVAKMAILSQSPLFIVLEVKKKAYEKLAQISNDPPIYANASMTAAPIFGFS
jgi:hypothetical protein